MDDLRGWAIMLCISAITSAFSLFIVPEGQIKKLYGTIISVFMLSVVIVPITGIDYLQFPEVTVNSKSEINEEYSDMIEEYIIDSGKSIIEENIDSCLNNICKCDYSIKVSVRKIPDGLIELQKIVIYIDKSEATAVSVIKQKIGALTGIVPEVKVE